MLNLLRTGGQGAPEELLEKIQDEIPVLPLRNVVAFPFGIIPLAVGIPRSVKLVEEALAGDRLIGLVAMKQPEIEEPTPDQIYSIGTVALIHRVIRTEEDSLQVIVQGLERFEIEEWTATEPYLKARTRLAPDKVEEGVEGEALQRSLVQAAKEVIKLIPELPKEVSLFLDQVQDPRHLVYVVAANSRLDMAKMQEVLELDHLNDKMRLLIAHLSQEREILSLGRKITEEAQEEMTKQQREYFLRQQLEAIRRELGEVDETAAETEEYRHKIAEAGLPEEAHDEAIRELRRMEKMPPQAAEYSVIKTYLDWLVELPWNEFSEDNLEIEHARQVLDEDHYDLEEVKERILEYLAVRKLVTERGVAEGDNPGERNAEAMGAILCFVGPPGVGKTSLGRSIARALGRKFTRMSLGGMRDEAEVRGHRRTYIGAMPGRIIQAIRRAGTRNPVFMLDEVDKIGMDWRGDPSSALLEVLDPQQNHAFRDHYLDVDFDLSDVIFITTANQLETIPPPLRDRMEVIRLDGYTEHEKIRIATGYLIPRQVRANGLRDEEISFTEEALRQIIRDYTREAGVRNLEREVGRACRKVAVQIASGQATRVEITPEKAREFLGKPRFFFEVAERTETPGVATGLAWTPVGGDVLFVEATIMRGKGDLTLTGQLGDVMKESARIAYSYIQAQADQLGIDPDTFSKSNLHLHVPEGAVPKDGPSAGVAMVTAIASLLTGRPVRADAGMTGEITLRGRVLPIGGTKQKILAAHRTGLKTVLLPRRNEMDLDDLPEDVRSEMKFILVDRIDEVLEAALRLSPEANGTGSKAEEEMEASESVPAATDSDGRG